MSQQFVSDGRAEVLMPKLNEAGGHSSCRVFVLPDKLFNEISDTETPQGVLSVARMKKYSIDEVMYPDGLFIILDSVQDPGNMGTIIRTADAAGFTAVIALEGCVDVYNPKVLRSTMGSVFHIPVIQDGSPETSFSKLKSHGVKIYAAHLKGTVNYFELDVRRSAAFVIGNESKGISDRVASLADELVRIPMIGQAESLNASVAASLLMYESVRQRISKS